MLKSVSKLKKKNHTSYVEEMEHGDKMETKQLGDRFSIRDDIGFVLSNLIDLKIYLSITYSIIYNT